MLQDNIHETDFKDSLNAVHFLLFGVFNTTKIANNQFSVDATKGAEVLRLCALIPSDSFMYKLNREKLLEIRCQKSEQWNRCLKAHLARLVVYISLLNHSSRKLLL